MILDKVKFDIATDILPNYQKTLPLCSDYESLGTYTKHFVKALAKVVFPGEYYELAPILHPQEDDDQNAINGEQSLV